ncbi:MAG: hypothetical protein QXX30_03890 [Candidatus Aenigmatarchaeota archaeon]
MKSMNSADKKNGYYKEAENDVDEEISIRYRLRKKGIEDMEITNLRRGNRKMKNEMVLEESMRSTEMSKGHEKRLVFIVGGKGGVGKTLFCRTLYFWLNHKGASVMGLDADRENPEFFNYHAGVKEEVSIAALDILETQFAKRFFTLLAEGNSNVVLVDMPGASSRGMREQFKKFDAIEVANELGYRVTMVSVLNTGKSMITSIDNMLSYCETRVDYVIVKNDYFLQSGDTFSSWENSVVRQAFVEMKANHIEINLPALEPSSFEYLQKNQLSFFEIDQLDLGEFLLVRSFLKRAEQQIRRAGNLLGYDWCEKLDADIEMKF